MAPDWRTSFTKRADLGLHHPRSRIVRLLRHAPPAPLGQLRRAGPCGNPRTPSGQPSRVPLQPDPPGQPLLPGLELATAATRWLTGLPLVVDQLIVLAAVRIVLVLGIFLVIRARVPILPVRAASACSSTRPVHSSTVSTPSTPTRPSPSRLPWRWCISSSSPSMPHARGWEERSRSRSAASGRWSSRHHVTGWITVGFLVVWAAGLSLTFTAPATSFSLADVSAAPSGGGLRTTSPSETDHSPTSTVPATEPSPSRRRTQARLVGVAAACRPAVGWCSGPVRRSSSRPSTSVLSSRPRPPTSARPWAPATGTEPSSRAPQAAGPPAGRSS